MEMTKTDFCRLARSINSAAENGKLSLPYSIRELPTSAVVYEYHIYLFGGYSGNNSWTRVIETYSDGYSSWRKLPYLLHKGLEGALVLKKPASETSVLIFGGKTNQVVQPRR